MKYLLKYKSISINYKYFKYFSVLPNKKQKNLPAFHYELEKELSKITNINTFLYYIDNQDNDFLHNDYKFLRVISKYREFDELEINSDKKVFILLDYLIRKDIVYTFPMIKSLMSLLFSKKIFKDIYWDFIYSIILKERFLLNKDYIIDIIKAFSVIPYKNVSMWNTYEESIKDKYKRLEDDDLHSVILSFIIKKEGSEELMKDLIEYSKEKSDEGDIIVNYTLSIIKHYRNIDIYHKFIGYSINYLSDKTLKLEDSTTKESFENIDLIYQIFPGFHNLLRNIKSYKHTDRYKKEDLMEFVMNIEKIIGKFLELKIIKTEEEDVIQISYILRYLINSNTNFKLIKTKHIISFYQDSYYLIKDYKVLLNYMTYFNIKKVPFVYISESFKKDTFIELLINNIHLMSYKELLEILVFLKTYHIESNRLLVFIQNNILKIISEFRIVEVSNRDNIDIVKIKDDELSDNYNRDEYIQSLLEKEKHISNTLHILSDDSFYLNQNIFLPFINELEKQLINIRIKLSWVNKDNL